MATAAMRSNSAQLVAQVYDQHLNFACPEASMFSLGLSGSYRTLNDPRATDMVIEELVERAANSLLSVLVTMCMF